MNVVLAQIDRDYIAEPNEESRVGTEWTIESVNAALMEPLNPYAYDGTPKTRWHCKDDDGEVYYGGWLLDDDDATMQEVILNWCARDAGCTTIEIKNLQTNEWEQVIG